MSTNHIISSRFETDSEAVRRPGPLGDCLLEPRAAARAGPGQAAGERSVGREIIVLDEKEAHSACAYETEVR